MLQTTNFVFNFHASIGRKIRQNSMQTFKMLTPPGLPRICLWLRPWVSVSDCTTLYGLI